MEPFMTKTDLVNRGISKTVFSRFYPETKNIIQQVLLSASEDQSDYEDGYTGKQDHLHGLFLDCYQNWVADAVTVNWAEYPFRYPSNGSSEAIREQIAYLKAQGYEAIYTFKGEYEGYSAIASAMEMIVVAFDRDFDASSLKIDKKGAFFLSQPSSIDGNVWNEYELFIASMNTFHPDTPIYVDLCYVGCVSKLLNIQLTYSNIHGVFFSLSKAFGVYFHRIGGVFLREANPLMYGNMWFKNLLSMKIGRELMNTFALGDIPRKYLSQQAEAIEKIGKELSIKLESADVVLLANACRSELPDELYSALVRESSAQHVRICLTPTLEKETVPTN